MNMADRPRTWDGYFDFYKKVQDNLRKKGERKIYGLGFQVTANGVDPAALFNAFMHGYGGQGIVTPEGKLNLDDEDQGGGDQGRRVSRWGVSRRLCAAERDQLERRRRQ